MQVTVVGAGVVGCAVAHELASRGVGVLIVDMRGVGRGATRASAGILAPQIEGHTPALRQLAVASLGRYDDFIHRIQADSGGAVEYRRTGTAQVALDVAAAQQLVEESRMLAAAGVEHRLVERDELCRLEPELSGRATAGLVVPSHGYVRAAELTRVLADAAVARGARLSTVRAVEVEEVDGRPRVSTEAGPIESDAVVVASGAWPVDLRGESAPAVTPVRGQLLQLKLDVPPLSRVVWGPGCYLVPWLDGSVLVGATVEEVGFDERTTAEGVRGLLGAAAATVPVLGRAHLQEVRVGLRPRSSDELPIVGRSPTMRGVFHALGHYRNGILLAPLTAALLADLIVDGREAPELALVRPDRFGTLRSALV